MREVHSPLCFLSAFSMFGALANTRMGYHSAVNRLARCTFGAYLFQTHQLFRVYLWESLFHFTSVSENSLFYFFEGLTSVVVIFIFAVLFEAIRQRVMSLKFAQNVMRTLSSYGDKLYSGIMPPETNQGGK